MKHLARLAALAIAATLPLTAQAHHYWLLPSSTVLSSPQWITVDAAVSNDMFHFNHVPLGLEALNIVAPDGGKVAPENMAKGKLRSTFDAHLTQPGTYRIQLVRSGVRASWKVDGQPKRWNGSPEAFAKEVPADAAELQVGEFVSRLETFATVGSPSALKPAGQGLELVPLTHPNDLVAGESATFQMVVDGKPAAGVEVTVVRGQSRYRNQLEALKFTTDEAGKFSVTWPQPGMYWLDADLQDAKTSVKAARQRMLSYTVTLEVLPQ
ncbi:DUF4198 domain-containing protein [Chitiniphilus purpureus]|uniref:DUF4198 domain-containing protein n=1 Tax=Chitiniphilus purpureus TaxID=2981137 RepID=A0ABY6DKH4_9NEIS|nr:DUF4198 domain-containing protein [Chitiniphilus sp. CD1]UXY14844.1 DUF4198 domain-containing protein [Chitiniphilus sp. CD1]